MNKHIAPLALAFLTTFIAASDASAVSPQGKGIGIGVEVGAPTNINAKFMLGSNQGVVVGVGGGIWYDFALSLHADYLFHPLALPIGNNDATLSPFVGIGAWTSIGNSGKRWGYYQPFYPGLDVFAVGVRIPLGLSLAFHALPIELFVEIAPSVAVFPGIGVFGQGGLGARFYF